MSKFITTLQADLVDDSNDKWRLLSPLVFMSDEVGQITIPKDFETDFASVPRLPFAYLLTGNTGRYAATVHDYLYGNHKFDRATADRVFLDALNVSGVAWWRGHLMYCAVRVFGGKPYNSISKAHP